MNQICLVGRLTADPVTKTLTTSSMCEFTIAVRKIMKDEADFFTIKTYGKTAEFAQQYLSKGRLVSVSGRMESRKYEKDGQTKTFWDVVAQNVNGLDKADSDRQPGSKIRDNDPWIRAVPPPPLPGEIEDPFAD